MGGKLESRQRRPLSLISTVAALMVAATLAACSDDGDGPNPRADALTTAKADEKPVAQVPCSRDALAQALEAPAADVSQLRCADGYAAALVALGETRQRIFWRRTGRGWDEVERVDPDECLEPARRIAEELVEPLCGATATAEPRPANAPCTDVAFQDAVKREVDNIPVEIISRRCRGGYARTVIDVGIGNCLPEATAEERRKCRRVKRFYWKDHAGEWSILIYERAVTCKYVAETVEPGFPQALCARGR